MWSGPAMSRHNPVASKRRRLPYVAKIKRDDPFLPEDEREIEAMCKRIAASGEYMALAGWREDAGYRVIPLRNVGKGPSHAALDRPQRHSPSTNAQAGRDSSRASGATARGLGLGPGDRRSARCRAGLS